MKDEPKPKNPNWANQTKERLCELMSSQYSSKMPVRSLLIIN